MSEGRKMYELCKEIFPLNRSITGDAVRETFRILQSHIPDIEIKMHEVPSGTEVLDWTVPDEWNCSEAYLEDPDGNRIEMMQYLEDSSSADKGARGRFSGQFSEN